MKIKISSIIFLFVSVIAFTSCNYFEKKKYEKERTNKVNQLNNKIKTKYNNYKSFVDLNDFLSTHFSHQIEDDIINTSKYCLITGSVLDIERVTANEFILHIKSKANIYNLEVSKLQVDNIMQKKYLSNLFLFQLTNLKPIYGVSSYVSDYEIYGDNIGDAELDYTYIDKEIDGINYIFKGKLFDVFNDVYFYDVSALINE
jgi:hypothetical protein